MASLDNIFDYIKWVNQQQGIITLWTPDSSEKRWFTANNGDPSSLSKTNKFGYFTVPYPLLWVDDSNNGKFHFGRQWKYELTNLGLHDNSIIQNANMDNEQIISDGSPWETHKFWRIMQSTKELFVNLQTDPNTWLPFVIIPADGSPGSYDRKVYFPVLYDNTYD